MNGRRLLLASVALLALAGTSHAAGALQGFGRDLPLDVVIKQIVPPTHQVVVAPGIDRQRPTSWTGGRAWETALADALAPLGLTAQIDGAAVRIEPTQWRGATAAHREGGKGLVILPSRGASVQLTSAVATAAPADTPRLSGPPADLLVPAPATPPSVSTEAASPIAIEVERGSFTSWLAAEGKDLREVLISWAEEAGWSVVWRSDYRYPLQAGASFDGEFTDAASLLLQNFASARPPVRATFYKGNRVLLVENQGDISGE